MYSELELAPTDESLDFAWLNMTGDEYAVFQLEQSAIEVLISASPIVQE